MPDPDAILARHWPIDGPHTQDKVTSAAEMLAGLVRSLNHATGYHVATRSLPYASDVDRVIASLEATAAGLPQLLNQLAETIQDRSADGALYDANARTDPDRAVATAEELMGLLNDARAAAGILADRLTAAHIASARLGDREVRRG